MLNHFTLYDADKLIDLVITDSFSGLDPCMQSCKVSQQNFQKLNRISLWLNK